MPEPQPTPEVESEESIARHCRHSSCVRRGLKRGAFHAFLPDTDMELSVVRSSGITDADVHAIGVVHVARDLKGHASMLAQIYRDRGLSFHADGEPHARHANVIGWDADHKRNRITAVFLADASTLFEY